MTGRTQIGSKRVAKIGIPCLIDPIRVIKAKRSTERVFGFEYKMIRYKSGREPDLISHRYEQQMDLRRARKNRSVSFRCLKTPFVSFLTTKRAGKSMMSTGCRASKVWSKGLSSGECCGRGFKVVRRRKRWNRMNDRVFRAGPVYNGASMFRFPHDFAVKMIGKSDPWSLGGQVWWWCNREYYPCV